MKRILSVIFSLAALIWLVNFAYNPPPTVPDKAQRIKEAIELNRLRTMDPALGYISIEEAIKAKEYTIRLQNELANAPLRNNLTEARWKERGPYNVGGRTRSILIDKNDATRNTIWAGSVTGGLWKSTDIASSDPLWEQVDDFMANLSIGSIAQDPVDPQYIYAGTGEFIGNSVRFAGTGVYRTTNGGDSWELLAASSNFRSTRSVFVHPITRDVYAATSNGGLQRSQDFGDTWERVSGKTVDGTSPQISNNYIDIRYANASGYMYVSASNTVRRSLTGDPGSWAAIKGAGYPGGFNRTELAVSSSDPEILYLIGTNGGATSSMYASTNFGETWQKRGLPGITAADYSQAWYDLDIEVSPFNPSILIAGEISVQRSVDGGFTWNSFAPGIHSDHHKFVFDEEIEGRVYFGNDGGVYRSTNNGGSIARRNRNYITSQFYGCAIHSEAEKDYFLAGAQDNGSWAVKGYGKGEGSRLRGGDGFLCHIDQNEPDIQMVSSQFASWGLSIDGGKNFSGGAELNGGFLNPSDYDDNANILYTETNNGDYYRWFINTGVTEVAAVAGFNINISTIHTDPNVANRVYFGSYNGQLVRIDNAHDDALAEVTLTSSFPGAISSLDIEIENPDHLLLTVSNTGVKNVWESTNGGTTWESLDGNLPNTPVNSCLFNPKNAAQAFIATNLGVWSTELLDGNNTTWIPPVLGSGTPITVMSQLQLRQSDNVILVSSYGRGLFTTDALAEPKARMLVEQVGYTQGPVDFVGAVSVNADSWVWDFGDGSAASTAEDETHIYDAIGEYPVSLTINDGLSTNDMVKILTDKGLPYEPGTANYSGDFEGNTEDYGVYTISGSSFSRGSSTINGKNGTHSGDNAFVLGIDEDFYQKETHSMLYIPNFNMEDPGIYEFSFWTKYRLNQGVDGFRVEYSTDRGGNWDQLGSNEDENWYNYKNTNLDIAGFEQGASYFSGNKNGFIKFSVDISALSGQPDVAFRFVFKAASDGSYRGVVIDDVEITKYDGELATDLRSFSGEFTAPTEITLSWLTTPEYHCVEFELERSFNGYDFEKIQTTPAKGGTSADMFTYDYSLLGQRKLYFFRLKVINTYDPDDYNYEFYSETIVVRKDLEGIEVQYIFPNPIQENIYLTFTDVSEELAEYELFSSDGKLVAKGNVVAAGTATVPVPTSLTSGVYLLSIQIGEGEEEVFKLLKN